MPWQEATASVVIHKGVTVLSLALYIFLGLALAPFLLALSTSLVWPLLAGPCPGLVRHLGRAQVPASRGSAFSSGWLCPRRLKDEEPELQSLTPRWRLDREHPAGCSVPGAVCAGLDDSRH